MSFLPLSTVLVLLLILLDPTRATWSILAIDKRTHQIGSALATCLDKDATPADAANILRSSFAATPCRGAILAVAQANVQDSTGPTQSVGAPLLDADYGKVPEAHAIINAMVTNLADPGSIVFQTSENSNNNNGGGTNNDILLSLFDIRQYGVVTYSDTDPVASYTGPQLSFLYEAFGVEDTEEVSLTAESDDFVVSVQGNIVAPGTVAATMDAFLKYNGTSSTTGSNNNINTTDSCDNNNAPKDDFAERLLYSLKQGYLATGIGDVRCVGHPASKGAVLAYLKILDPSTGDYVVNLESSIGLASSTIVNTNITNIVNGTSTTIVTPGPRPTITFNVDGSNGNFSAVDAIEADLEAWRETHPAVCLSKGEASTVCANRTNLPDYEEESTVPTSSPTTTIVTSGGAREFGDTRKSILFAAGFSALTVVATIF